MNQMNRPITHHEALIYVMVTLSAVDRTMTDKELMKIGDIVRQVPVFADFAADRLVAVAEECSRRLQGKDGLEKVLDLVADTLPERLYETAYALAVEVAAADLHVEQEELRFLQILRDRFDLDKLAIAAIEHSARVRYRLAEAQKNPIGK
jgi:tellurite resistance protein